MVGLGWLGVGGALALTALLTTLPQDAALSVAAAAALLMLAVGTPHGALDHLTLARRAGIPTAGTADVPARGPAGSTTASPASTASPPTSTASPMARLALRCRTALRRGTVGLDPRFAAGYLACGALALAGYLTAPQLGFAAFLALSVAHFAAGEAGVAVERGLARGWGDPLAWAAATGGVVVVVLPLSSAGASDAVAAVDPRLTPVLAGIPALAAAAAGLAVVALLGCLVIARRGGARRWAALLVAAELVLLIALGALAHPLVAFAAYFGAWHALRHQARLAAELHPGGESGPALLRVAESAVAGLPASLVVLVGGVALALSGQTALGAVLAVVWALTVPHTLAVARFEWRRRRESADPSG